MRKLFLLFFLSFVLCPFSRVCYSDEFTVEKVILDQSGENPPSKKLTVHFIDVGGGDGILIDTPSGKKILIDGGPNWKNRTKGLKEYHAYIKNYVGNDIIDLIIISHPDYDHFGGLTKVVEDYDVRQVWYNGYQSDKLPGAWDTFLKAVAKKKIPLNSFHQTIGIGSVIRVDDSETSTTKDDVTLTLINSKKSLPKKAYGSGRSRLERHLRNSASVVIRLDYGENSILFTGDTNGRDSESNKDKECDDQEKVMLEGHDSTDHPLSGLLDCDILKVAHHGSNGSSSLPFMEAVSPEWAVVSAGFPHGHPHDGSIKRLKMAKVEDNKILRTDYEDGDTGPATEKNLGDDCYQFTFSPAKILKIKRVNLKLE